MILSTTLCHLHSHLSLLPPHTFGSIHTARNIILGTVQALSQGESLHVLFCDPFSFPFYWNYWGDTDSQNYTGFRRTIPWHTICPLYCGFTIPSQVSTTPSQVSIYPLLPLPLFFFFLNLQILLKLQGSTDISMTLNTGQVSLLLSCHTTQSWHLSNHNIHGLVLVSLAH